MSSLEKNLAILKDISELKDNWDLEGAKAFSPKLIQICTTIITMLDVQPEVFPTKRKSIQFEYENNKKETYLEFEIFEDKTEVFQIDKSKKKIETVINHEPSEFIPFIVAFLKD